MIEDLYFDFIITESTFKSLKESLDPYIHGCLNRIGGSYAVFWKQKHYNEYNGGFFWLKYCPHPLITDKVIFTNPYFESMSSSFTLSASGFRTYWIAKRII